MSQYSQFIKTVFIRNADESFPEYDKYKYLVEDVPEKYEEWLKKHFAATRTEEITDEILHYCGCYPRSKEEAVWQKRIVADKMNKYPEQIELVRFYNHNLDRILTDANECLSNPKLSKKEKRTELEKCNFEYHMFRHSGRELLKILSFPKDIVYKDKSEETIDIKYMMSVFCSLIVPDDYRGCKLFLDLCRLCGDSSKLYPGIYYAYYYIHNIFTLTNYNDIGYGMMPFEPAASLEEKKTVDPIISILKIISRSLNAALAQLKNAKEALSSDDYNHLRIVNHTGPSSIFEENMNRDMKNVTGSPEQIKIAHMIYALAKIMEPVDLVIDYLNLFIHDNSESIGDKADALKIMHQELRHARGEIQYLCFANDMIYDDSIDCLSISKPFIWRDGTGLRTTFAKVEAFSKDTFMEYSELDLASTECIAMRLMNCNNHKELLRRLKA